MIKSRDCFILLFLFMFGLLSMGLTTSAQADDSLRDKIIQAGLPTTAPERLKQLAKDTIPTVRAAVAGNRASPDAVLIGLSAD